MLHMFLLMGLCHASSNTIDVTKYGAVGDGKTDDTQAIVRALAAAATVQPTTVVFPINKTFLTMPLNMSTSMTLQVDGTLRAISPENMAEAERYINDGGWPQIPPLPSYGNSRDGPYLQYQAFIYAKDARDIAITGAGTIDGQGNWWWDNRHNRTAVKSGRPNLVQFVNCTDVEVTGVTLQDSPFWCLHPVYCNDVHIHHMAIRSRMYAPNSDGIDPDSSRNVMIENNDVSCGDDNIAIKAGVCGDSKFGAKAPSCLEHAYTSGAYRTENITVRYNKFRIGMGISIGSESSGGVKDVEIYDNIVGLCDHGSCENTCCGWGPALHFKTALTRGGIMENIMFRNNTVYNNSDFIDLETNYQSGDVGPVDYPATVVRNISFIGNRALGGATTVTFECSVNDVCEEISVINNTVLNNDRPWECKFVHTYNVVGNSPPGLADCMHDSMNRTVYV